MNFYKDIENYFLELRGRLFGLSSYNLLSPKEIQTIKKWETAGVPLKVIHEGIEEALIRFLSNYPHRRDDPPNLLYCQPTVLKHFRNLREAAVGDKPTEKCIESKREKDSELIDKIINNNIKTISILEKQSRSKINRTDSLKKIKESALSDLNKLRQKKFKSVYEIEDNLEDIKVELQKVLSKELSYADLREIIKEIRNELAEFSNKMTRKAYKETRNSRYEDKIFDIFGISSFKTKT